MEERSESHVEPGDSKKGSGETGSDELRNNGTKNKRATAWERKLAVTRARRRAAAGVVDFAWRAIKSFSLLF
jgi:hypothetical protein